jgi:hypothetical protein
MEMTDEGLDPEKENLRYFEWYRPRSNWFEEYGLDLDTDA